METLRRLHFPLHIPFIRHNRSTQGDVPGGEVPSVREYTGKLPKGARHFERIVKALNGGVDLNQISETLDTQTTQDIQNRGSHRLWVIFRDSMGWKIASGAIGTTLTIGAAFYIYETTKKILENRNKSHR